MDGHRFDDLARAVAAGSRRRVVKGIVGGVLAAVAGWSRLGSVRAQQQIPLGGQCSALGANAECSQAGTPVGGVPVVCSDNGVLVDGAFNCCRNAGGLCTADFHCCGAASCLSGICGGGTTALPLGASCTSTSQCSQVGGSVVCASNGLTTDGGLNCCRNTGGACAVDSNCCGADLCVNNVCGGTAVGNLPPGAACTTSSQCSQTGGTTVCGDNGIAADGALNCCRNAGGACLNSAACCASLSCVGGVCTGSTPAPTGRPLGAACTSAAECDQTGGAVVCANNGIAADGATNCCRNAGGACTAANNSAGCCSGLYCVDGFCTDLSVTGQLPPGSACTDAGECSQVGGPVICADNGSTTDGALNCCRTAGGACSYAGACCAGLVCSGGVCTGGTTPAGGLAPGASCTSTSQCSQVGGTTICADNGLTADGSLNCCRNAGGACTAANNSAGCCGGLTCVGGTCQ